MKMSLLKKNVLANVGGQAISAVVGLFLIPLYIRFLGKEGYGLVAFFMSIQGMAAILDLGLSTTANREMGRLSAQARETTDGRDLMRTLEYAYYATGIALFAGLALASEWIAHEWVKADEIEPRVIWQCVVIAGASIALRWPTALYYGVMKGLERQVQMNVLYSIFSALRAICTLLVLLFVARTVLSFYWFQMAFGLLEVLVIRHYAWQGLRGPESRPARFRASFLSGLWRYALSVSCISIFAIGLKQVDKIWVSKLLPIEELGFYTTAVIAGMGLGKIGAPIQSAIFPRLSKMLAREDTAGVAGLFHSSAQLFAFLTCAGAGGLMFFGREVLFAWTRSQELADHAAMSLAITAAAMMLNGMMSVQLSLILASGHTRISLYMNGLGLLGMAPAAYFLVKSHGIAGAAMSWFLFNAVYFLAVPYAVNRKIPGISLRKFYLEDTIPYAALSVCVFAAGKWIASGQTTYVSLGIGVASGLVYLGIGLLAAPNLRRMAATAPGVAAILNRFKGAAAAAPTR